jgi:hypothetical protein
VARKQATDDSPKAEALSVARVFSQMMRVIRRVIHMSLCVTLWRLGADAEQGIERAVANGGGH